MVTLGAQVYDFADFAHSNSAAPLPEDGSLIGAGIDKTVITLSSVAGTAFPPLVRPQTTVYDVQRVQPIRGPRLYSPIIRDLTIRVLLPPGLPANAWFNGLRVAGADNLLVQDVLIQGVPGSANTPPGETQALSLTNCANPTLRRVEIDGKRIGGALFGFNHCQRVLVQACRAHHAGHSHGFTAWQCQNVVYQGCAAHDNGTGTGSSGGVGFNHEDTDSIYHYGSAAYGNNSMGSHRYYASGGTSRKAQLVGTYSDAPMLFEGSQRSADVAIGAGNVVPNAAVH